ncbi:MAG TPA: CIA30 family protein [Burkholderiaceae bacterium]
MRFTFTIICALLCQLGATPVASAAPQAVLIQNVRVFDGARFVGMRSVQLADGKIVSDDFKGQPAAGTRIVDGAGRTLLPGLIDAHVHATQLFALPLVFGVTTQIDMFTAVPVMQRFNASMARGENGGAADVISAGTLATVTGGHGSGFIAIPTLSQPGEAQAFVDARIAEGSHFIKIVMEHGRAPNLVPTLDLATVQALIEAAHKRGKLAVVHIGTYDDAKAALAAGADGLVHLYTGPQPSARQLRELAALALKNRAFVIPTAVVLNSSAGYPNNALASDARIARYLERAQLQTLNMAFHTSPKPELLAAVRPTIAALAAAGVPVLAGTDAGNPGTIYGASLHEELVQLVAAGLTNEQALAAATSAPARAFRLLDRGRIAPGMKADLLLVDGDPGTDIQATRAIVEVWKDGVSAHALREQTALAVADKNRKQAAAGAEAAAAPAEIQLSQFSADKLASPIGSGWVPSNDSVMGGKSTTRLSVQPAGDDGQAGLQIEAKVAPGYAYPWSGVTFFAGKQRMQPGDLSMYNTLRFKVRGDGQRYSVSLFVQGSYIPASIPFTAEAQWKEISMPFSRFGAIDPGIVTMLAFNAGPLAGDYRYEIKDVRLLRL